MIEQPDAPGRRILVVDDDPSIRGFLEALVQSRGYLVQTASNGREALALVENFGPGIILSDIDMPEMDGLQFLSAVRETSLETIVIMITGLGSEEIALEALRRHANDFLRKPVQPGVLLPLLDKYAEIVESRTRFLATRKLFVQRTGRIKFGNDFSLITEISRRLISETWDTIDRQKLLGARIGLTELIINAMEHGNLNISAEEKKNAMDKNSDCLDRLRRERLADPILGRRQVTIDFSISEKKCSWTISDEGSGFNFSCLPDPRDPVNLTAQCGRGIFLATLSFDSLEFQAPGNVARAEVTISQEQQPSNPRMNA